MIISNEEEDKLISFNGWAIEFNTLMPFIRHKSICLGYIMSDCTYFCYINFQQYVGSLEECLNLIQAEGVTVPKVLISALKKYVREI